MNEAIVSGEGNRQAKGAVRVAILEDHQLMREMLASALGDAGFQIQGAAHPEELFQKIEEQPPHVVIIDLTLEGDNGQDNPDGFSLLQRIRKLHPGVPQIVFSATKSPEPVQRSFEAGAQGYRRLQPQYRGRIGARPGPANGGCVDPRRCRGDP